MLNTIWGIVYRNEVPDPLMPPSDSPNLVLSGDLPGSVDAAHAHDLRNRRSTTGFAFMLAGGAVSYRSKTQSITATSSTEAEFLVAVTAAKHAKYLRAVLHELGFSQRAPTPIYEDNIHVGA